MTSTDIMRALQASRPAAPDTLRDRVREIVTAEPPPRPTFGARLSALVRALRLPSGGRGGRRPLLVLIPATAVAVALAAGLVQLVRPDDRSATVAAQGDLATTAPATTELAPGAQSKTYGAESSTATTEDGRAARPAAPKASVAGGASAAGATLPAPAADRAQRTSVSLGLEVKDTAALSAATQRAIATTRELGGYLVSVQYGSSETGAASLVAKVPTERVQDAIARLSELGTITSQDVRIDDLQASLDDVNRRNAVLRKRIAAITAKLDAGGLPSDLQASLEATRQSLRDELAGNRRSGQAIRADAAMATFDLQLRTKEKAVVVPAAPSRLDRALDDTVGILAVEGIVLLYAAVVLVPLALAVGVLALVARMVARRGRDRLLEAS